MEKRPLWGAWLSGLLIPGTSLLLLLALGTAMGQPAVTLGPRERTEILQPAEEPICQGATLVAHDDGTFENAVAWQNEGVAGPPDYFGAWADRFGADFVCGIQLALTRLETSGAAAMDVILWMSEGEADPVPGNVICLFSGIDPEPVAEWPEITLFELEMCCQSAGPHFLGFWPSWPGAAAQWFLAADEDGPGTGTPRTKIAPGIEEVSGWQHPGVHPPFAEIKDLGIREYGGMGGGCQTNPARRTTWGAVKALYGAPAPLVGAWPGSRKESIARHAGRSIRRPPAGASN